MGSLARGSVVLIPFPFSDLTQSKLRPAVCMAPAGRDDWIFCQVTSNPYGDALTLTLQDADFAEGGLRTASFARPRRLFTANDRLVVREVGRLTSTTFDRIVDALIQVFRP